MPMRKNEIMPFATMWMELESIILSEISQSRKTDIICFHSYVELEKLTRRPWGKAGGKIDINRERGRQTTRNLKYREQTEGDGDGREKNG